MKKIASIFFVLIQTVCFSFTSDSTKTIDSTKVKKFELGISFSPDYCFRKLKAEQESQWIADSRDSIEVAKFGYTTGIDLAYNLNSKFNIQTGVLFSDGGERTKKTIVSDVPYGQEAIQYSYNYHHYYLSVPVKVDYKLLTGKLKVYITAGVAANFFLGHKTTFISTFAHSNEKTSAMVDPGFSKMNLSVLAGLGLKYPITSKANLKVEPTYRRSINSIIDAPVKSYLYSAGINIGIFYTL